MPPMRSYTYPIAHLSEVDTIRLFPNDADFGLENWTPEDYEPSTLLARDCKKLQEPGADIVLTKFIGSTGMVDSVGYSPESMAADIYYADVKIGDDVTSGLVVKVIDYMSRTTVNINDDFRKEAELFSQAKDVQGTALHRFAGRFTSGSLEVLVFEDAGRRLTDDEYKSKDMNKDAAVRATKAIQATGVSPWVHSRGFLCRSHDGRVTFSSLWLAKTADEYSPERLQQWMAQSPAMERRYRGKTAEELLENNMSNAIKRLDSEFHC